MQKGDTVHSPRRPPVPNRLLPRYLRLKVTREAAHVPIGSQRHNLRPARNASLLSEDITLPSLRLRSAAPAEPMKSGVRRIFRGVHRHRRANASFDQSDAHAGVASNKASPKDSLLGLWQAPEKALEEVNLTVTLVPREPHRRARPAGNPEETARVRERIEVLVAAMRREKRNEEDSFRLTFRYLDNPQSGLIDNNATVV